MCKKLWTNRESTTLVRLELTAQPTMGSSHLEDRLVKPC